MLRLVADDITKFKSFKVQEHKLYKETFVQNVSDMFFRVNDDIKSLRSEGVHLVYIIDRSCFKGIDYEDHIPFSNYISY